MLRKIYVRDWNGRTRDLRGIISIEAMADQIGALIDTLRLGKHAS